MINLLQKVLKTMDKIDGWHIVDKATQSQELFYVKQGVDMNRAKAVHHFQVTVYKDFEEGNEKYKGSSITKIAPTMTEEEVREALNEAAYAATFVKNAYYPLVDQGDPIEVMNQSTMNDKSLEAWLPDFTASIFKYDRPGENALNSAELFLNKHWYRIMNSQGVDVAYNVYDIHLEFITNCKGPKEEVELFRNMDFSEFRPEEIAREVKTMINFAKERSQAKPTPSLKDFNVLLTGGPVQEFLSYYVAHANVQSIYEKISTFDLETSIQGQGISGDKLSISLDPMLANSSQSRPYDIDGLALKKIDLIQEGILKTYYGNTRYSYYLDKPAYGNIKNLVVAPGSKSLEEMKGQAYLELVEFSDFQMDILTGDFAGEIRLGLYFDGQSVKPVTSGSISANIKDVQDHFFLSKETYQENNYHGPRTLQLPKLDVNGQDQ